MKHPHLSYLAVALLSASCCACGPSEAEYLSAAKNFHAEAVVEALPDTKHCYLALHPDGSIYYFTVIHTTADNADPRAKGASFREGCYIPMCRTPAPSGIPPAVEKP